MKLTPESRIAGLSKPIGEELLRVHPNYQPALAALPAGVIKGLAHITGGGLLDNLPRVLPSHCDAIIDTGSWRVPALFTILQENGGVEPSEMYQVFNMGIGMAVIVAEKDAAQMSRQLRARRIGSIDSGKGIVQLVS